MPSQKYPSHGRFHHDPAWLGITLACLVLHFPAPGVDAELPAPEIRTPGALNAPALPQPATHVVDRLDLLSIQQRSSLGRKLLHAAEEEDISIYVLILNEAPKEEAQAYFSKLATHWKTNQLVGFIVGFRDDPASKRVRLHILPGKVPTQGPLRDHLLAATTYASEIGDRQRNVPESIEAATLELLAQYRGILAGKTPTPALTHPVREPAPPKTQASREFIPQPFPINLPVLGAATALLLSLGAIIAVRRHRRRFVFPVPEYRYRLCAPFSGGNSVRIDYRVKYRQPPH